LFGLVLNINITLKLLLYFANGTDILDSRQVVLSLTENDSMSLKQYKYKKDLANG
jgi:hypothetical protein